MTGDGVRAFLDAVEARRAAATPGPWTVDKKRGSESKVVTSPSMRIAADLWHDSRMHSPDAEFIAAAPETQRRLVAAIEAVLTLVDEADRESAKIHPRWIRAAVAAHLDPKENPHG